MLIFLLPNIYYFIEEIETKKHQKWAKTKGEKKNYNYFWIFLHFGSDTTNFNVFLVIKSGISFLQ